MKVLVVKKLLLHVALLAAAVIQAMSNHVTD
jgi:hypothetical protein